LSAPANRESLYSSLKQLKEGDIVSRSIKDIENGLNIERRKRT
jgi:hypothetical protein